MPQELGGKFGRNDIDSKDRHARAAKYVGLQMPPSAPLRRRDVAADYNLTDRMKRLGGLRGMKQRLYGQNTRKNAIAKELGDDDDSVYQMGSGSWGDPIAAAERIDQRTAADRAEADEERKAKLSPEAQESLSSTMGMGGAPTGMGLGEGGGVGEVGMNDLEAIEAAIRDGAGDREV